MKKIVCYGDSITFGYQVPGGEQVVDNYPKVLNELLDDYEVINEGHSGWRSINGAKNFDELVLAKEPDIVIIMFGINDAKGSSFGITLKFDHYWDAILEMVDKCNDAGIRVIICGPTPTKFSRVNKFSKRLRMRCESIGLEYIDMGGIVYEKMLKMKLNIKKCFPDGIHLNDDYYRFIAEGLARHLTKDE